MSLQDSKIKLDIQSQNMVHRRSFSQEQIVKKTWQRRVFSPIIILTILLFTAIVIGGYFYWQYKRTQALSGEKVIEDIKTEIGELMILPDNEEPTLATVTDREKLTEQSFFEKAENGDRILIYSQSGRAILYRPSIKKIIDVTAINIDQATSKSDPQPNPSVTQENIQTTNETSLGQESTEPVATEAVSAPNE